MNRIFALALVGALGLSACGDKSEEAATPADMPALVSAPAAQDFDAVGTEPFWNVKVRGSSLTLSRPDAADVVATSPAPEAMGDTLVYWGTRFNLTILNRACSDGMSDRKYAYEAEVRIGDEVLKGCADKPGASSAQPS